VTNRIRNWVKIFITLFIALIPLTFSFQTTDPTLSIRFLVFTMVLTTCLILITINNTGFQKNIFKDHFILTYIVLICIYVISFAYNGFSPSSLYETMKLVLFFIFLIVLIHHNLNFSNKSLLLSIVTFSFFTNSIYFILLLISSLNIGEISSTMGHKNLLASIQFLTFPFSIFVFNRYNGFWKNLSLFCLITSILIFALIQSRAILLALLLFSIVLAFIYRHKVISKFKFKYLLHIVAILFLLAYVASFQIPHDSFKQKIERTINYKKSPRFHLISASLKLIKENLLIGVGPGNWKIEIPKHKLYEQSNLEIQYKDGFAFAQRPHNDFILVLSECGLFAGLCYIIIFLILIRRSFLYAKKDDDDSLLFGLFCATLIGYFFISLVDFPLERIAHNVIFITISSIIISKKIKDSFDSKKSNNHIIPILFLIICSFGCYMGFIRHHSEIKYKQAEQYKKTRNWDLVIDKINSAYHPIFFDINNTSTPLSWFSGVAFFNKKNIKMALYSFKKAYTINPNHVHVINNLASCYELSGDRVQSSKLYKEALNIIPDFKESRVNLAAIFFNKNNFTKSLDVILKSRIISYEKRKLYTDKYDVFLKKITYSYIDSIWASSSQQTQGKLTDLKHIFNHYPDSADKIMRDALQIRQKKSLDYVDAIFY
tara:strand:+ start:85 stop:2055 length:1971 start_codon:yes stop_codon:yes gene_type:complete